MFTSAFYNQNTLFMHICVALTFLFATCPWCAPLWKAKYVHPGAARTGLPHFHPLKGAGQMSYEFMCCLNTSSKCIHAFSVTSIQYWTVVRLRQVIRQGDIIKLEDYRRTSEYLEKNFKHQENMQTVQAGREPGQESCLQLRRHEDRLVPSEPLISVVRTTELHKDLHND